MEASINRSENTWVRRETLAVKEEYLSSGRSGGKHQLHGNTSPRPRAPVARRREVSPSSGMERRRSDGHEESGICSVLWSGKNMESWRRRQALYWPDLTIILCPMPARVQAIVIFQS